MRLIDGSIRSWSIDEAQWSLPKCYTLITRGVNPISTLQQKQAQSLGQPTNLQLEAGESLRHARSIHRVGTQSVVARLRRLEVRLCG